MFVSFQETLGCSKKPKGYSKCMGKIIKSRKALGTREAALVRAVVPHLCRVVV